MRKLLTVLLICTCALFASTYKYDAWNVVKSAVEIPYIEQTPITSAADLIMKVNKKVTYPDAYLIAEHVWNVTVESNLSYSYVLGIMMTESRFNANARSNCGAMGLMQVMPSTFTAISTEYNLDYSVADGFDIEKNIRVGILYLDKLLRKYGHIDLVSAGYNGGPRAANNYRAGNYDMVPKQTLHYIKAVRKHEKYFAVSFKTEI